MSSQYALINPHKAIQLNTKVSLGKLPQVSFLLWQKFCHNKHMFVMTKHIFCCEKSMFAKTKHLSWQNYVCYDKIFLSQQNFGCKLFCFVTNTCLLQQKICHDKHTFVVRKDVCQMQIVIVLLEYKVEGDRTEMELKQIVEILYWMHMLYLWYCVLNLKCSL